MIEVSLDLTRRLDALYTIAGVEKKSKTAGNLYCNGSLAITVREFYVDSFALLISKIFEQIFDIHFFANHPSFKLERCVVAGA